MAGLEGRFHGENGLEAGEQQRSEVRNPELDKIYRNLFRDDYDGSEYQKPQIPDITNFNPKETLDRLFADDFAKVNDYVEERLNSKDQETDGKQADLDKVHKTNGEPEADGNINEVDDNGMIYKDEDGLKPDTEYVIDGVAYKTDGQGRIISCDGDVKQTPDGERDLNAQKQVGGEDRREGDQGGHILSRILGGAKGIENLLAIRGTINNGPYKSMEKEINQALDEGKDVHIHVDVKYDGDSKRPSQITAKYTIDGKETVTEYDNDEGSTDLIDTVEEKVDKEQYDDLKQEIADANADGGKISVIAVKTEYDGNGDVAKVTVTMRDENTGGPNEKRVLLPKGDGE